MVTALFWIPYWASRDVSVAPIIAKVAPDEMPRNSAASGARSRYGRTPAGTYERQPTSSTTSAGLATSGRASPITQPLLEAATEARSHYLITQALRQSAFYVLRYRVRLA